MDEIFIYTKTKELSDRLTNSGVTALNIQFTGVPDSDTRYVSPMTTVYFIYVIGNFNANTFHLTLEFSKSSNVKFKIVSTESFSPGGLNRIERKYEKESRSWSIFLAHLDSVLKFGKESVPNSTERALDQTIRLDIDELPTKLQSLDVKDLRIQVASHNTTGYVIFVMGKFQADTFHLTVQMSNMGSVKFLIVSVTQFPLGLGTYRQRVFSCSIGAKYGRSRETKDDFIRNLDSVLKYGIDSKSSVVKLAEQKLTDDGFKVVWNGKDDSFTAEKSNICLRIDKDGEYDDVFMIEGVPELFSEFVSAANERVATSIIIISRWKKPLEPNEFLIFDDSRLEDPSIFNTEPNALTFKTLLIHNGFINGIFSISRHEHIWNLEVRGTYKEGVSFQFHFYFEREPTSHLKPMWYSEIIVNNKAYSTLHDATQEPFETIATKTIQKANSLFEELLIQITTPKEDSEMSTSGPPKHSAFHSDTALSPLLHRLNQFMD